MSTLTTVTEQPPKLAGEERFDYIRGRFGL
ncbi:hypothetical protein E143388_02408 [Rhodococcus opacus]|nr:hypothetical protein E143388_02408 [Rhodococcus opacus]